MKEIAGLYSQIFAFLRDDSRKVYVQFKRAKPSVRIVTIPAGHVA